MKTSHLHCARCGHHAFTARIVRQLKRIDKATRAKMARKAVEELEIAVRETMAARG